MKHYWESIRYVSFRKIIYVFVLKNLYRGINFVGKDQITFLAPMGKVACSDLYGWLVRNIQFYGYKLTFVSILDCLLLAILDMECLNWQILGQKREFITSAELTFLYQTLNEKLLFVIEKFLIDVDQKDLLTLSFGRRQSVFFRLLERRIMVVIVSDEYLIV